MDETPEMLSISRYHWVASRTAEHHFMHVGTCAAMMDLTSRMGAESLLHSLAA
jgi:hypothetical protein